MGEREAEHKEEGPGVRGVPDVSVKARGDELVRRVHGEVEGKEFAEGFEAVEADVGA